MAKSPKSGDDPTQDPAFKRVVRHFLNKKPEHKTGKTEPRPKFGGRTNDSKKPGR